MANTTMSMIPTGSKIFEQNKYDRLIWLNDNENYKQIIEDNNKNELIAACPKIPEFHYVNLHKNIFEFADKYLDDLYKIQNIINCEFYGLIKDFNYNYNNGPRNDKNMKNIIRIISDIEPIDDINIEIYNYLLCSCHHDLNFNNYDEIVEFTNIFINIGLDINYVYHDDQYDENILTCVIFKDYFYENDNYQSLELYIDYLVENGLTNENLILFVEDLYTNMKSIKSIKYIKIKKYIEKKYKIIFNDKKMYNDMISNYKNLIEEPPYNDDYFYERILNSLDYSPNK